MLLFIIHLSDIALEISHFEWKVLKLVVSVIAIHSKKFPKSTIIISGLRRWISGEKICEEAHWSHKFAEIRAQNHQSHGVSDLAVVGRRVLYTQNRKLSCNHIWPPPSCLQSSSEESSLKPLVLPTKKTTEKQLLEKRSTWKKTQMKTKNLQNWSCS